jgi:probable HAF family extracellular repeat protein
MNPGVSNTHAILWEEGGEGMRDLGTLHGGSQSLAFAINDRDVVVGYSNIEESGTTAHAFIWTRSREIEDLNDLIPANSG